MVARFKPETGLFIRSCFNSVSQGNSALRAFLSGHGPTNSNSNYGVAICIIVKTTIDRNSTKGFEEIFNKLTESQDIF